MDDHAYDPPKSRVADSAGETIFHRGVALIWRISFLLVFAALNLYLAWASHGKTAYLVMGFLCLGSAALLMRLSRWAQYPLYAATFMMGGALVSGIVHVVRRPEIIQQMPLEQLIISWLIPVVPTALLVACCTYARTLVRSHLR